VVDRVDTTARYGLGLTSVARAARHKYDPITQCEFFRSSLFNNVPEKRRAVKIGNSPPYVLTPTLEQEEQLATLENNSLPPESASQLEAGKSRARRRGVGRITLRIPRLQWAPSAGLQRTSSSSAVCQLRQGDERREVLRRCCCFRSRRFGSGGEFDGRRFIHAGDVEISASSTSFP